MHWVSLQNYIISDARLTNLLSFIWPQAGVCPAISHVSTPLSPHCRATVPAVEMSPGDLEHISLQCHTAAVGLGSSATQVHLSALIWGTFLTAITRGHRSCSGRQSTYRDKSITKRCDWHRPNYFIWNVAVGSWHSLVLDHSLVFSWIIPLDLSLSSWISGEGHAHRAILPVLFDVCPEMMSITIKLVWRT